MPILMIAWFALAGFGLVGVLLTAAVVLEGKKVNAGNSPVRNNPTARVNPPANKPAA